MADGYDDAVRAEGYRRPGP